MYACPYDANYVDSLKDLNFEIQKSGGILMGCQPDGL